MGTNLKELEEIRTDGLKALREKLGVSGMIKFLQMYTGGHGDYTEERETLLKDVTIDDFKNYVEMQNKK